MHFHIYSWPSPNLSDICDITSRWSWLLFHPLQRLSIRLKRTFIIHLATNMFHGEHEKNVLKLATSITIHVRSKTICYYNNYTHVSVDPKLACLFDIMLFSFWWVISNHHYLIHFFYPSSDKIIRCILHRWVWLILDSEV